MQPGPSSQWEGYFLSSPLRRLRHDPRKILGPYVSAGMTVLDVGCGMGFFSLALAKMVGAEGRVVAIDLQPKMIQVLSRRAAKAGLSGSIDARVSRTKDRLGIDELASSIHFALAFGVIHELSAKPGIIAQIHEALIADGRFLLVEPRAHISTHDAAQTEELVQRAGFSIMEHQAIKGCHAVLLEKM